MTFEDRLVIATPEGVDVELTLAGIGSRFMAGAVDLIIQILVGTALFVLLVPIGEAGAAVFTVATFAMIFFYDVLFEVLGGGRTPGKRLNGLKVVRAGGRPITLVRSAVRNLLRVIDILPAFYALGMLVVFATPRNQRIGDLVAGTHVIRERAGGRGAHAPPGLPRRADPERARGWDLSGVTAEDVAAVRAFLERRGDLERAARNRLAAEFAERLRPRVAGAPERVGDEEFLELVVAAKAARAG
jgi:uncharacterized RDD family membrane protein YckC